MGDVVVVTFPGSNCDADLCWAVRRAAGLPVRAVWHKETELGPADAVLLPGGFSYGDYLRCGAIARFSPVMEAVWRFAEAGGPVLGICNGFQVLTEAGLLPGALVRNRGLHFICQDVELSVEGRATPFTHRLPARIRLPIAHMEGRYVADEATLDRLEGEGQVLFRYRDNPNGSMREVAGVCNTKGNVVGLMPHPERAVDPALGGTDGCGIFTSLLEYLG